MEAAEQDTSARSALQALINEDRQHAEQHTGAYAFVIWELLLLASMDREHGREQDAERCDLETEDLLTMLAADGEPKNWSNNLASWVVLISLTGRKQDRPSPGKPEAPLFAHHDWSPDVRVDYLGHGREHLASEVIRLAELAEHKPCAHLGELVEVQRKYTLRSVKYWELRTWRVPDELRRCFDAGVHLARKLVDVNEPLGRAALSRALADRTSMHVAARDFPPALRSQVVGGLGALVLRCDHLDEVALRVGDVGERDPWSGLGVCWPGNDVPAASGDRPERGVEVVHA